MKKISAWIVQDKKPLKLQSGRIELERHLEDWIENDPSMIQGGLVIVSRQLVLDGGRLDLLAIDPQGRWVVIELKAGLLDKEVITQSLFYVSQIAKMPHNKLFQQISPYLQRTGNNIDELLTERGVDLKAQKDERETIAIVVGTGNTVGLDKLISYFSDYKIPVSAITFDVFESLKGEKILVRELTESDFFEKENKVQKTSKWNLDYVKNQAKNYGTYKEIDQIIALADKFNFYVRPYAGSIMVTPMENKSRMLFTIWLKRNKDLTLKTYIGSDVFPEFYDMEEKEVIKYLGDSGWRNMIHDDLNSFIKGIETLFTPKK